MKNFIENISRKSGLTKTEINTLVFISFTLIIGWIAKTIKSDYGSIETPKKFNYSSYDSLFNKLNYEYRKNRIEGKNNEKRVDSQAELYDFSTNKKDSKKNKSFQLEFSSIDINTADEKILTKLPGIGTSIAKRILNLKEKKGRFQNLEELLEVKGIGTKKLAKVKKYLYIEK